jgi:8-oxo-dGTP pyrophosphatase MutT (NUDIX family)
MGFDDTYRLSVHAVIMNEVGHVLQLKATYGSGGWGLPGGCLDPGETIHQALLRECREELGCSVDIRFMSGMYYHRAYNSHACIFLCRLPHGTEIRLSAEHSEYRFFALDELTPVQRQRVQDCLDFAGQVRSAAF